MSQLSPVDLGNLWPEVPGICHGVVAGDGTVNLSNPRAIFAGSRPRFTRSRVTYEAYVVSSTSTRPQIDSAGDRQRSAGGLSAHRFDLMCRFGAQHVENTLRCGQAQPARVTDQRTGLGTLYVN